MIYIFIFIYLFCLSIHFDISEHTKNKELHWRIALILLILVAGLRWRVGSDTVVYVWEFYNDYPDLFHLKASSFSSIGRMPLWVLMNSLCKTLWNDFLLLQFIIAFISISINGYFIKKTCNSLRFFVLLCYFIGVYTNMHMEMLRESLAMSMFLLAILAFNNNNRTQTILYAVLALMFHIYAIVPIFLFISFYFFMPSKRWVQFIFLTSVFCISVAFPGYLTSTIESYAFLLDNFDTSLSSSVVYYATNDRYGQTAKSFFQYISIILQCSTYIFMYLKFRKNYSTHILLKSKIFEVGILIFLTLLLCKFSFSILYRFESSYFYFFGCYLAVAFTKLLLQRIVKSQRLVAYLVLIAVPVLFAFNTYYAVIPNFGSIRRYVRYYPYSSIFDKTLDSKREVIYQIRGFSYSDKTDY